MARRLLIEMEPHLSLFGVSAMLLALGAASTAIDAIQSLTSPQPASSQPIGFGPLSDVEDSSAASSSAPTVSGFSSAQISFDNLNALLDAQSLSSGSLAESIDSGGSTSDSSSASAPGTASSAYDMVNQLTQSGAIPLAFNPFSVSA
jgi:hypothetical protein